MENLTAPVVAAAVTTAVFLVMLAELRLSQAHERALRARGAVEPEGDVYAAMAWAYPAGFIAMGLEGALFGPPPVFVSVAGIAILGLGKAIKYWAIRSLGPRWTFRVLVLRGAPLVTGGPYAFLRHPNYVGVIGELLGVGLLLGAFVTCAAAVAGFIILIRRRMAIEDRALGRQSFTRA